MLVLVCLKIVLTLALAPFVADWAHYCDVLVVVEAGQLVHTAEKQVTVGSTLRCCGCSSLVVAASHAQDDTGSHSRHIGYKPRDSHVELAGSAHKVPIVEQTVYD
jgi:hypothetical protein